MRDFFFEGDEQPEVESLKLELSHKYEKLLKTNILQTIPDFMVIPRENSFRDVPNRLTVGLDLKDNTGTYRIYLKRHWADSKGKSTVPHEEARSEAENISLLKAHNIPVPDLVAFGWGYLNKRSVGFVAMNQVPGLQGDHFIEQYSGHPDWSLIEHNLVIRLADLSRKFHELGFNHRDFYLCHFFVKLAGTDVNLNLIDLQRVQKRKLFRDRWLVKDLAQMCYSSLNLVKNTTRMRFFLKYAEVKTLSSSNKKLIKKILKKTDSMVKREREGKIR